MNLKELHIGIRTYDQRLDGYELVLKKKPSNLGKSGYDMKLMKV